MTDDDGGVGTATAAIDVGNVAPQLVNLSAPELIDEGEAFTVMAEIVDPGVQDAFKLEIDWGDGTTDTIPLAAGTTALSEAHVYEAGGVYTVQLNLTDDDQGAASAMQTAVVTGAGVNGGILQVVGSAGDDHAVVGELPDGGYFVVADFLADPGQPRFFDAEGVTRIDMLLGEGNDLGAVAGAVDMPTLLNGQAGNDLLLGGLGHAVLLGGEGHDRLFGAAGANLMIGGGGPDLIAGNGDDILVGGRTAFDTDPDALMAIMNEWTSGRDLGARSANLLGTGTGDRLNEQWFLQAGVPEDESATVFDDDAPDLLMGSAHDWFFGTTGADEHAGINDVLLQFGLDT